MFGKKVRRLHGVYYNSGESHEANGVGEQNNSGSFPRVSKFGNPFMDTYS